MTSSSSLILQHYIKLTEFLGKALGPDYEVALHDLTRKDRSIIAIANNYISGREVGAPLTNMALSILRDKSYEHTDYHLHYYSINVNGKDLRSSTFFIKDNGKLIGLLCINCGVKNLKDKENSEPVGTFIFWAVLGVVIALGRWLPALVSGILVVVMCLPAIFKKVKKGAVSAATKAETEAAYEKIGMKIFAPTLSIGVMAVICAITGLGIGLSALNGVAIGVLVSVILLMIMNKENKPSTFLNDSERMLSTVGPLSMLPMLLACLGTIFTKAGVGDVISDIVSHIVPEGNVNAGIVVYAIGMMLFTMIMGNAYAAITVMTVGIGYPFVLAHGANPTVIGMLALTCGFCGTLCTPMAANFNTVPVALLDMKKPMGVIKNQVPVAIIMLIVQIVVMIMLK